MYKQGSGAPKLRRWAKRGTRPARLLTLACQVALAKLLGSNAREVAGEGSLRSAGVWTVLV